MNKMASAFANGKALIPFITCGDPDLDTTAAAVKEAVQSGADMIVLGIPFSDPTAEGPVIQAANIRALNGGVKTDKVLALVRSLREDVNIPMVFMTYANVVFSYGAEAFISACADIGIDGLLLPDIPYEEKDEFLPLCRRYDVRLISMIAPAPASRIKMIAEKAEGFIYLTKNPDTTDVELREMVRVIRESTSVPCVAGCTAAAEADGVIVDEAMITLLEQYGSRAPGHIGKLVSEIKQSLSAHKQCLSV